MNLAKKLGISHQKIDISPIIRYLGAYDLMSYEEASDREAIEQAAERTQITSEEDLLSIEQFSPKIVPGSSSLARTRSRLL
jgi:NAD+ synthase